MKIENSGNEFFKNGVDLCLHMFSKSRGTGVFGDAAKGTGIDADVWRSFTI